MYNGKNTITKMKMKKKIVKTTFYDIFTIAPVK